MISFRLGAADVGAITVAATPVTEVSTSLIVHRFPHRHPEHGGFLTATGPAFARLADPVLSALVTDRWRLPDFLFPRPAGREETFAEGLDRLRGGDPEIVARDIELAYLSAPVPAVLRGTPERVLARVADSLAAYWDACLAPHWTAMRAALDADAAHRGGLAVTRGLQAMVESLFPTLRWTPGAIFIDDFGQTDWAVTVAGRELRLVPSLFLQRATTHSDLNHPPVIYYPARGRGSVWLPRSRVPDAVEQLVGPTRAALLARLGIPATTTELARETDRTAPMINRHLTALHRAGLLERVQKGRSVYYSRSSIADQLIGDLGARGKGGLPRRKAAPGTGTRSRRAPARSPWPTSSAGRSGRRTRVPTPPRT
ncbi:transcriptional regulator [Actinorhabdospora filicis]|uniref:Transcriptional regulator n=1 Tax=Actinorhabdospora filicis TaxID=1785913 RepID=A0A9W6SKJ2_9ACTN|nr:helix-turn-helix domain-containing protein [Actinorhabdospora filicis]GLZ77622.1 transcriptional regulator [Actinorhabdospora filicis]